MRRVRRYSIAYMVAGRRYSDPLGKRYWRRSSAEHAARMAQWSTWRIHRTSWPEVYWFVEEASR